MHNSASTNSSCSVFYFNLCHTLRVFQIHKDKLKTMIQISRRSDTNCYQQSDRGFNDQQYIQITCYFYFLVPNLLCLLDILY